jgi:hypothetical protein
MKRIMYLMTILFCIITFLSSCGGSSGGGAAQQPAATTQTRAIVKLSTSGTTTRIGGVDVKLALPSGVTVKATASPPETDPGVAVASGQAAANSLVAATYTAGSPGIVHVVLVNSSTIGIGNGEFATITCDLASGVSLSASAFVVQQQVVGETHLPVQQ